MSYYHFKNENKNQSPTEILYEAHKRIYQNYMNQREKEKLRAWIKEEIRR